MAAPHSICTKRLRAVVCFCGQGILKGLKFTYVYVLSMGTFHYLHGVCTSAYKYLRGRASVTDSECSGCPTTATNDNKREQVRVMILKDISKSKVF
jgi:hypothetical protein